MAPVAGHSYRSIHPGGKGPAKKRGLPRLSRRREAARPHAARRQYAGAESGNIPSGISLLWEVRRHPQTPGDVERGNASHVCSRDQRRGRVGNAGAVPTSSRSSPIAEAKCNFAANAQSSVKLTGASARSADGFALRFPTNYRQRGEEAKPHGAWLRFGPCLLLCGLCGLLFGPAALLGGSNACARIGAEHPLLPRTVAEAGSRDPGSASALQKGTNFFEAADLFVDCSN